ncbi:hypothetical protein DKT77_13650 [Meridianimarinicoccus roseus]|uniref:Ferritin/DPS domain-containing protein n=2 Tax=Meridianimarinicoccus roseus TaxID=2072018 RepID=A0A2V2LJM6_9RHOB|nr:hypothetical protein DKT77_13650 [Meridianimarinicoccus roseus]
MRCSKDSKSYICAALGGIAERICIQGACPLTSVYDLMARPASAKSADDMVAEAIAEQETIAATLRTAVSLCADAGDEGSAGLLTDRLESHEEGIRMLRASRF